MLDKNGKIILPGGAGLVGQNLIVRLKKRGYTNILVMDKHEKNLNILKAIHPDVVAMNIDLSLPGDWQEHFNGAFAVVMLQAQIGGLFYEEFLKNNISSTELILDSIKKYRIPKTVHISSSVVMSSANDFYTQTKTLQEQIVIESGVGAPVLRPTLMFGWFDRKHLGWLSRLMKKTPIFPIPGDGRYSRQPLYAGDFSEIIISCIENRISPDAYDITGLEKIDYIDIIKVIKKTIGSHSMIVKIPFKVFYGLLWLWTIFDKNPPFTTQQLSALVAKDEFEITDWPKIFDVKPTLFREAIKETFSDPKYGQIVLNF
jgi:nucleoside-diphosphate-sugar epimerase